MTFKDPGLESLSHFSQQIGFTTLDSSFWGHQGHTADDEVPPSPCPFVALSSGLPSPRDGSGSCAVLSFASGMKRPTTRGDDE